MNRGFTRGLIAGSVIGAAVAMMIPSRNNAQMKQSTRKNSMKFVKKAGGIIGEIIDML